MTITNETDTTNTANLLEKQLETEPKTEPTFAGLSVILRSIQTTTTPIELDRWLALTDFGEDINPIWIPLRKADGVTKIMPVLPDANLYEQLMRSLWRQIASSNLVEWRQKPYEIGGVEVNSDSLHKIAIAINSIQPLPPTLARAIHALCFRWFANTSPELAANLHQQETLPLTTGWEYCSPQKNPPQNQFATKRITRTFIVGNERRFRSGNYPRRNTLSDAWLDRDYPDNQL